jgi:hypothetical protein
LVKGDIGRLNRIVNGFACTYLCREWGLATLQRGQIKVIRLLRDVRRCPLPQSAGAKAHKRATIAIIHLPWANQLLVDKRVQPSVRARIAKGKGMHLDETDKIAGAS